MKHSKLVMTDSGGRLGRNHVYEYPSSNLKKKHRQPVTIVDTSTLYGLDSNKILI